MKRPLKVFNVFSGLTQQVRRSHNKNSTLPKTNIAPEKMPSQKETHLPTPRVSGAMVVSGKLISVDLRWLLRRQTWAGFRFLHQFLQNRGWVKLQVPWLKNWKKTTPRQVIQSDMFIPWLELKPWKILKGSLNHPKKVTKNCQGSCFVQTLRMIQSTSCRSGCLRLQGGPPTSFLNGVMRPL